MTKKEKIETVVRSEELITAMKLLVATFIDCDLKSNIRFAFEVNGRNYEMILLDITEPED